MNQLVPLLLSLIHIFLEFNNYINSPVANYNGEVYNLPFNMNTFSKLWNIFTPQEAKAIIENQRQIIKETPTNLEEQAISLVGTYIYKKLIKEYTCLLYTSNLDG